MPHGAFLIRPDYKSRKDCSIHHVPLIFDPVRAVLIYTVDNPVPLALPARVDRCPVCYPTVEALMRFGVDDFWKKMAAADRATLIRIEKLVVLWKDGRPSDTFIL